MSDFKQYLKKILIIALVIYVCFLLQTSVFSRYRLAGVTPNVLICVVSTYGFMKGRKYGILIGFFVGILLDIFSGGLFGMYALIYMYIGLLNGLFKKQFFGDDLRLPMILIGTSDLIYGVATYLALFAIRSQYDFSYYLLNIILPEVVYTLLVSIFVYYAILHINNWVEKLEKKGSDRIGYY
ncbi:rod shape-determining protein MreD [Pseudobutyrivibrio ruminis]|uniref:Rod shape-determining protein MreD n=2 Tax=Pseudobutyrivibrio ruminis TaxID=46206 RepID=A0A1H7IJM6_9FIRM|nr:rod shape-determining protein MreD [Pseudobutyrivibrio ruminis]SEK62743.1 rod shape-determining protein MreD [Pseudobutyrivibrio ruminis]SOB90908.1 rod shape-determining protein MreD [Pseudobutyrivibrio ruminis DSM 9787]